MKKYFAILLLLFISQTCFAQYYNLGAFWRKSTYLPKIRGAWQTKRPLPYPVADHTAVWTGTDMIIWGGYSEPNKVSNRGAKYNPTSNTWTEIAIAGAPPPARKHTAVWTGTEMIVWGGGNDYSNCTLAVQKTGGKYNPSTDTWTATSLTSAPANRCMHSAVWTGTEMIIWGGYSNQYSQSGGKYNPSTNAWSATSTGANVPSARQNHTAVWTGTEMIVYGGRDGTASYFTSGAKYTPGANTWATMTAGSAHAYHTAVFSSGNMVVWGGLSTAAIELNSGEVYNVAGNSWSAMNATNAPSARYYHSMVLAGGEAIVWGGNNIAGTAFNDGAKYDIAGNTWTPMTTTGAPPAASLHSAVWTGTEMIVWGGMNEYFLHSGGRYTPGSNTWASMSSGAAPYARGWQAGRMAGNEFLVYGTDSVSYSPQGYRYNLVSNSWSAMNTTNAPLSSYGFVTRWTGTELIVWGGQDSGGTTIASGSRYNPTGDTWTPMSASGLTGRRFHNSAWTGTEFIVWGGVTSGGTYLSSGSRYNPTGDTWTPMSAGPTARHSAESAWTGTEMIIWGGYTAATTATNSGSRYNPTGDSWTPMTTTGAPSSRGGAMSVWTGTEFLVWGGLNGLGTADHGDGARYSPTSNSWTDMATAGRPPDRYNAATVWTGTEMIIWGGVDLSPATFNDGYKYYPQGNRWVTMSMVDVPAVRSNSANDWTSDNRLIVFGGINSNGAKRDSFIHLYDPNNDRTPVACTDNSVPIGETCTGGGIYVGSLDGYRYQVTPSACQNVSTPICQAGDSDYVMKTWNGTGGTSVNIPGVEDIASAATASTVSGSVNTTAAVAHASVTPNSANDYCEDLNYAGQVDWFLPAKTEMALVYCAADVQNHNVANPDERPNCVYFNGKKSALAGFVPYSYWVSNETSAISAYIQNFSIGSQGTSTKATDRYVRCVRKY